MTYERLRWSCWINLVYICIG